MGLRERAPWWGKMGAKLVLSRLPLSYGLWRRLALFKHGHMVSPEYAYGVFMGHWERSGRAGFDGGLGFLELGPGDSLASGVIASAMGATVSYLVDVGAFASRKVEIYQRLIAYLRAEGFNVPSVDREGSLDHLVRVFRIEYLTDGLSSLRALPTDSVHFAFSHATLEHVRRQEFVPTMLELRRIVRRDGIVSHRVDLRDHLGGALNHLRFPDGVWESKFIASSGFYTNRIGFGEMCAIMQQAGFKVHITNVDRWEQLPTPRHRLAEQFRVREDADLLVSGFDVVLT